MGTFYAAGLPIKNNKIMLLLLYERNFIVCIWFLFDFLNSVKIRIFILVCGEVVERCVETTDIKRECAKFK